MLTRLLLTLLAACLSLPAIAAPVSHGLPTEQHAQIAANDCHKPAPQPGDHAQKHECVGCIASYGGIARNDPVVLPAQPQAAPQLSAQLPQTRAGPDTPPPRS